MENRDAILLGSVAIGGALAFKYRGYIADWMGNIFRPPWEPPPADVADMHWEVTEPNVYRGGFAKVKIAIRTTSAGVFNGKFLLDLKRSEGNNWHDDPEVTNVHVPAGSMREYTLKCSVLTRWQVGEKLDFRIESQDIGDSWFELPWFGSSAYYPSSEGQKEVFTIVG